MVDLAEMMSRHARAGRVAWIGVRSERRAAVAEPVRVRVELDGICGDHGRAGKRAVTLLQAEHLPVIAALLGREVTAATLRRNLMVSGANLAALRRREVRIGSAVLFVEGPCPPCSRMEEALGFGGYSAVRGHGGYYASVVVPGEIALGDAVGATGA
ncbi:MOSC domain-containing protein [Oceaniglobus roseus]|uniref:MOSC domain-containing protein n=1 Tax=Oceaniglobus roseus TaxID=1737570 RepID=UPI000C7EE03B|nr:MOSC domain-containing protein [Kandeliimicrobium roseum]